MVWCGDGDTHHANMRQSSLLSPLWRATQTGLFFEDLFCSAAEDFFFFVSQRVVSCLAFYVSR